MRHALHIASRGLVAGWAVLAGVAATSPALAQDRETPTGPIKLVVGYAAGGPVDVAARVIAPALQRELGSTVIVYNRAGASGSLGGEMVTNAAPDGNTLFFAGSPTIVINPNVQRRMSFDPMTDLTPIAPIVSYANVLVVNKDLPIKSVSDLVAYARSRKGTVTYGSAGIGGSNHLSGALLEKVTATKMSHVPYKGNAPALNDLMSGTIVAMFDVIANARPFIASGKVRALAVTSKQRNPMLPEVPTMGEAGIKDYEVGGWYGLYGPAGLPKPMAESLNAALRKVLADESLRARLTEMGYDVWSGTAEELAIKAQADRAMWATVSNGIEVD